MLTSEELRRAASEMGFPTDSLEKVWTTSSSSTFQDSRWTSM